MANARTELVGRVDELSDAVWVLAALASAVGDARLSDEHGALLAACGWAERDGGAWRLRSDHAAELGARRDPAAFPRRIAEQLRLAADTADGSTAPDRIDDAAFLADGRSSGAHMRVFLDALAEQVPGFAELLDRGSLRLLDVGTGIGAIAAAVVERAPGSSAVGLDVDARALRLAEGYLTERGLRDRIETRLLDVADLSETGRYDLAWLPLSVLSPHVTEAALPRIRAALRPGGRVIAATALPADPDESGEGGPDGGADVHAAVVRWRMARSGVTPWGPETVRRRLQACGFADVRSVGAPSGTVTVLTARVPEPSTP
ncbi:SAM-dependent methyltransferase [Nocardiopsis aegyptia]|uniref:SAM-dependent methyltransferase n=1 Tax=Nocardiopsis aegyptia TaxID=220378 RepID=A0A7Z0JD77_9ACTN|nr:class I SAM-dependent methyltransferase [Nocardiopsis aegyptia]NYJ37757.1 SAM-dependent methyltransferase [Nocardiopsis aegyptia]